MRWTLDDPGPRDDMACWSLRDQQGDMVGWVWADGDWHVLIRYGNRQGRCASLAAGKAAVEAAYWASAAERLVGR